MIKILRYIGFVLISITASWPTQAQICFQDFLTKNVDSGRILITGGGSVFETLAGDNIDAMLWLAPSTLNICQTPIKHKGKTYDVWTIINLDDGEKVSAFKINAGGTGGASSSTTSRGSGNVIDVSHNDETFIINGEMFKAKTYCFNVNVGDRVKFIEGSAFGACVSAKFFNTRTNQICSVWCE